MFIGKRHKYAHARLVALVRCGKGSDASVWQSLSIFGMNVGMAKKAPVFDDPTYMYVTSNDLSDGNYDPPSSFLDRIPQKKASSPLSSHPLTSVHGSVLWAKLHSSR